MSKLVRKSMWIKSPVPRLLKAQKEGNIGEAVERLSLKDKTEALFRLLYEKDIEVLFCHPDRLLQCVCKLVDAGVDVNQMNRNKHTPLSIAAVNRSYKIVMYLIEHGAYAHYVDSRQNNLINIILHIYKRKDTTGIPDLLNCVDKLVNSGVDVNKYNEYNEMPVFTAARKGLYEVVMYLVDHGIDVNCVDSHQNNLLHTLLYNYEKYGILKQARRVLLLQCIIKLANAGVYTNKLNADKDTPLSIAARTRLYEAMVHLLKHGIDIHYLDRRHNNLLHILLQNYNRHDNTGRLELLLQCILKLVDAGVDVNELNADKDTPISIASKARLYEAMIYLLEDRVDLHYVDSRQNNLLHIYLYNYIGKNDRRDLLLQGTFAFAFTLVDADMDVNKMNEYTERPRTVAVRNNIFDNTARRDLFQRVVRLVESGVDVNHLNEDNAIPISLAAEQGLYEVVIYLLEHGVGVHYVDSHQNNLLQILLYNYIGNKDIHRLLLLCLFQLDATSNDVKQKNEYTERRIFVASKNDISDHAARRDVMKCVVKLVDAGIDVNHLNEYNEMPVFAAARKGLHEVVIYLLDHGIDVHYVDGCQNNLMHTLLNCDIGYFGESWIHSYGEPEDKFLQLANTSTHLGLNINQPNDEGNTPLNYVGTSHSYDDQIFMLLRELRDTSVRWECQLINILLDAGCNINHQNEQGRTALMHQIKEQADISILKLLIPHSDLSLTDINGDTAISYCVQYYMINSTPVFKLLVDSGSDPMSRNNGVKLFHDILKCKRFWLFRNYIRLKLIVNGVTAEGENMLHLLARVNYDYCLKKFNWLLNNELDINQPCFKANTPTMVATFLLNSTYLELLTRHPRLDINAQNNQGHTALHCCIIGFTMFKDGLNKRQVNDVVKNYCRQIYPIYMACIDILLGVDSINVNIPDNRGRTSLMMAALKNDRVLTRKLLQAGAIVTMLDYSRRSALQYLDIYQSVFDLTCFKLLLSNGNTGLLNLPCIDGNTIIQTALCFPFFWEPRRVVCFIRYLVAENCCLQNLENSSVESSYNKIDLTELSHPERHQMRQLLYLSGALGKEIMTSLNFDEEDYEDNDTVRSRGREEFISICCNTSLKSLCRRSIRRNLGLGIQEKIKDLDLPCELNEFLLLKDILNHEDYDFNHIDDGCNDFADDDDYDGYDIDKDRDDDYSQYNYQYFTLNTDHELRQNFEKDLIYPNGDFFFDASYDDSGDYFDGYDYYE